jgi:adenine-specific DNA methylase
MCKTLDGLYEDVLEEENEEMAKAVCTYLSLAIDKVADYNSNLTAWHHGRETVGHTYTRGALPIGWDYIEVNPFSGKTGSWESAMDWIIRAIETCTYATGEPHTELGSATRLPYPDDHFDGVMTDPPYYDNMPYATIADFFYVWMKRSIGNIYPDVFSTPLSPKSSEIIEDSERHESDNEAEEFFETELSRSFSEISRVLKQDGICTIVFAHKETEAWAQMIRSVLDSGLVVTATWPIHTEQVNRPRGLESAALASSIYFVCRMQSGEEIGYYDEVSEELEHRVHERLDYFWEEGIKGADLIISAIGPAVEVFGQYERVERLSGEEVTADELLELTQRMVSDYALEKVLGDDVSLGNIDPETRFYILYRWAFANQKEDYDEVNKLAQVNGAQTDILERLGILIVPKDDARLQPPQKRDMEDDPAELPEENGVPMVDKIHRAAILWEDGRRNDLKEFIEVHCMEDDQWRATQAIAECLPENESRSKKEKQMLHGLLQYQNQADLTPSGQSYLERFNQEDDSE